jgi:uncharacterized protein (DUF1778 family)
MARPPKPPDQVRSEVLQLRLTAGERATLEAGAERAKVTITEFIRSAALANAKDKPRNIRK